MPRPESRRIRFSLRPFYISTLIITLLATFAVLSNTPRYDPQPSSSAVFSRSSSNECREVRHADDKCAFVRQNCLDDEAGLLPYLTFYYCPMAGIQPIAFVILTVWLGLLFTTIGIAASDFFSVNLSTIATILGLSESLAGVTFLAFGNGSPDVFSTFAAMGSNSGSMAVGELIGAASFITAVVAGSMALVREFKVSRRTFVRDICFFIAAVGFATLFLSDGKLRMWECAVMIAFYLFYVVTVVGWHWLSTRRKRRRLREAASRAHFYSVAAQGTDELEPYYDGEDDDDTTPINGRSRNPTDSSDLSALERSPRIEVDFVDDVPPDDDEDERGRHVAAEMTSSMRVLRPRGRRSTTTITPIRPSLVGALEFRSVLSSLQRERNMHLAPILARRHSEHRVDGHQPGVPIEQSTVSLDEVSDRIPHVSTAQAPSGFRDRALSSGDIPLNLENDDIEHPAEAGEQSTTTPSQSRRGLSPSISEVDGMLAPPPRHQTLTQPHVSHEQHQPQSPISPRFLQIQIPSPEPRSSSHQSPTLSPFPGLSESPLPITPSPFGEPTPFTLPATSAGSRSSFPGLDDQEEQPKPVKWWPYWLLPAPHVLLGTLFPTLQDWRNKSIWDKVISVISVPSVFLLVVSLPVVETESRDDESEDGVIEGAIPSQPGLVAPLASAETQAPVQHESEWQRYRRSTRSNSFRPSNDASPALIPVDEHDRTEQAPFREDIGGTQSSAFQPVKPPPASRKDSATALSERPPGWSRWLVILQLFTGPLFVALIVWANMREDLEHPVKTLVRLVLYSSITSLILLAVLLLTTVPDKRPRLHHLLCFLGFTISVAWISTVAGEVVGVLKAFGVILGISEAILGLTIFAVGNSLGDLVADVTVARLGYPVMALSACFGGPMLNILLGVGIGGMWMTIKSANEKHEHNPEKQLRYKPYHIQVGGTLMISAITVLITLVVLLVAVPWNKWVMSRRIGWGLIAIWTTSTVVNLVVELTGAWTDVS